MCAFSSRPAWKHARRATPAPRIARFVCLLTCLWPLTRRSHHVYIASSNQTPAVTTIPQPRRTSRFAGAAVGDLIRHMANKKDLAVNASGCWPWSRDQAMDVSGGLALTCRRASSPPEISCATAVTVDSPTFGLPPTGWEVLLSASVGAGTTYIPMGDRLIAQFSLLEGVITSLSRATLTMVVRLQPL